MGYKLSLIIITAFIIVFMLSCGDSNPSGSDTGTDTTGITITLDIPSNLRIDSLKIIDTMHASQVIEIDTAGDTIVYDTTRDTILARFVAYWDTVPRATHYFVYVLNGAEDIVRIYKVSGSRRFVTGLKPNDTYKFNIAAGKDTLVPVTDTSDTILQFIGKKSTCYYVPLHLPLPPKTINVNTTGQTALVSWSPSTDSGVLGYSVYLYDMHYALKDSQRVDFLTTSASFTSLQKDNAYKVNIRTRAQIGNSDICSCYVYDMTTAQDNGYTLPYVYVSTFEKPDESNAYSTVLGPDSMVGVQGGIFTMGNIWTDTAGSHKGKPVHEVVVSSFYLGKYEIDNDLFMRFLNSIDQGPDPDTVEYFIEIDSTDTANIFIYKGDTLLKQDSLVYIYSAIIDTNNNDTFAVVLGKELYPVSGVYWKGAVLFCNWLSQQDNIASCYNTADWSLDPSADGYRLPTEAEFEYVHSAAFLGKKQRYPWGYGEDPAKYASMTTGLDSVGSYKSYFGFHNLSGNVLEWCNDRSDYAASQDFSAYYKECLDSGVVIDPLGPVVTDSVHVLRGGSYLQSGEQSTSAWRHNYPVISTKGYGLRVARNGNLLKK